MEKRGLCLTTSVLIAILPSITQANWFFGGFLNSRHNRTRWSPYAHGLVSGDVRYSPYAHNQNSGLIPRNFRWSPYAHGLVERTNYSNSQTHIHPPNPKEKSIPFKKPIKPPIQSEQRKRIRSLQRKDPAFTIRDYLKSQEIEFKTTHGLNISSKTIGTHFTIKDKKIIIRYTNPAGTEELEGYRLEAYKTFLERSNDFCEKHRQLGWTIFTIKSDNKNETSQLINNIINSQ
jgi:hypothetical protein